MHTFWVVAFFVFLAAFVAAVWERGKYVFVAVALVAAGLALWLLPLAFKVH
jgi:hypothetical protein